MHKITLKSLNALVKAQHLAEALLLVDACRYSIKAKRVSHQGPLNVSIKFSKSDHRSIGNPKSACLHFYTAKTQAALALPFLPYSTLRVE